MINNEDKATLVELMVPEMEKFKLKREDVFNVDRLVYGDYMAGIDGENRPYVQVEDLATMLTRIMEFLDDQNAGSKSPMKLVMFLDACDHVSRVCRVLR